MSETCAHCGSKKVAPGLPVTVDVWTTEGVARGEAVVRLGGDPQAVTTRGEAVGALTASVCGECGHAELRVGNFQRLYEKFEQSGRT